MRTEVFILAAVPINVVRLRSFLKTKKSLLISGHTNSFNTALQYLERTSGIVLIDDAFFDRNAFENFIETISKGIIKNRIVIYTGRNEESYFKWFADKGIRCIVHKESPREEIVQMVHTAGTYSTYIEKAAGYTTTGMKGIALL